MKALVQAGAGKTAASITLNNNNDKLYLAVDDGTDGYLYFVDTAGAGAGNAIAQAAEILLVGTFSGDALTLATSSRLTSRWLRNKKLTTPLIVTHGDGGTLF